MNIRSYNERSKRYDQSTKGKERYRRYRRKARWKALHAKAQKRYEKKLIKRHGYALFRWTRNAGAMMRYRWHKIKETRF